MEIICGDKNNRFFACEEKIANLIIIDVLFNEAVIPCVFDTGASVTVMKASAAKNINALMTGKTVSGGNNSGQISKADMAEIRKIEFGKFAVKNHKIAVAPDEAFDFGLDDEGKEISISAFLGWDIISHFKWSYNAGDNSFIAEIPSKDSIENSMDEWDNMPIINARCFGENRLFGLDTGHTESILGGTLYGFFENCEETADLFVGIGGACEEKVRLVKEFELEISGQNIAIRNISAVNRKVFPCKNAYICGLLGMDILENKSWVLDYKNRVFRISD